MIRFALITLYSKHMTEEQKLTQEELRLNARRRYPASFYSRGIVIDDIQCGRFLWIFVWDKQFCDSMFYFIHFHYCSYCWRRSSVDGFPWHSPQIHYILISFQLNEPSLTSFTCYTQMLPELLRWCS